MSNPLRARREHAAEPRQEIAPGTLIGERLVQLGFMGREAVPAILRAQLRWGCRFGEAAIAGGAVAPADLAEALADIENIPYTDLIADPPEASLLNGKDIDLYLRHLVLPWRLVNETLIVACADPSAATRALVRDRYGPRALLAATSKFDVIWTVQRLYRDALAKDAAFGLDEKTPEFSARQVMTLRQFLILGAAAVAAIASFIFAPTLSLAAVLIGIGFCYAANIVLRVLLFAAAGLSETGQKVAKEDLALLDDRELPVYSVIVPLYREAHMVGSLVAALKALEYPGLMAQTPQAN